MIKDITKKSKEEQTLRDKLIINLYDTASVLVVSLVTIMLIFTFIFRIVIVSGSSMVPTLTHGDFLMVSAFDKEPEYKQVVIVTQPNWIGEPIVKRIIATENQTVDIDFNLGKVYVDGVLLDEPYINELTFTNEGVEFPVTVPENHVFVMGDNRNASTDSRSDKVGFIHEDYILGVVKYRMFARDEITNQLSFIPFSEWKVS